MIVSNQSSSHWYGLNPTDGKWCPYHEVPYADAGKGNRKTTLSDARKMQLVPSVTGICGIINAPSINNYRVDQAIKSALTLPRQLECDEAYMERCWLELGFAANNTPAVVRWCKANPPRPLLDADEFAKLVVEDAEAHSEAAKKLGTEIHDAISGFLTEHFLKKDEPIDVLTPPTETPEVLRLCQPATEWILNNVKKVHAVEEIVGSLEHGFAGTMDGDLDLKGIGRAVVDWKSQNVKRNGKGPKPEFYLSYGKQLAAYGQAVYASENDGHPHHSGPGQRQLVSVIIDKANKGEVFIKVWENPDELWRQFLNNAEAWRFENGYDPRIKDPLDKIKTFATVL